MTEPWFGTGALSCGLSPADLAELGRGHPEEEDRVARGFSAQVGGLHPEGRGTEDLCPSVQCESQQADKCAGRVTGDR